MAKSLSIDRVIARFNSEMFPQELCDHLIAAGKFLKYFLEEIQVAGITGTS